jgi:hypothetical protein
MDEKLLAKWEEDPNALTDEEYRYVLQARKMYDVSALAQFAKLTSDRQMEEPGIGTSTIIVNIGEDLVRDTLAQQTAAKQLLGVFTRSQIVEGEARVVDGNGNST